jgi:hypothetical protein
MPLPETMPEKTVVRPVPEVTRKVTRCVAADALPHGTRLPKAGVRYVKQTRRRLNPDYDSDAPYTPREGRKEWDAVGLVGKLRLRKGQPTGARWRKMRDVSEGVEEWLVR